jgi:aspartyl-tRNA(Asn)/glutamyl-tRNA(Gln) amidotransferase subunit C
MAQRKFSVPKPTARIEILTAAPALLPAMTDSAVDAAEVRHVADLARLDLDEDEVERFTAQLGDIVAAFDALEAVPEVDHEADLTNVMRADEEREGLSRAEALRNAPETEDGFFKGPRVS